MNEKKKLNELKEKIELFEAKENKGKINNRESNIKVGFKISTEIVAALVVGVVIGIIVDNYFGTRPFGLIIFFILGAFAGFLNVYRVMRQIENHRKLH